MKTIKGDLIQLAENGQFDLIVHGCNCFCTMGAGIARQIKDLYPEAFAADLGTAPGDIEKLGGFSLAEAASGTHNFMIINAYTQYHYSGTDVLVDYDAVQQVFRSIREQFPGLRVGYPKIGAGLAGGDWERISGIIDDELNGMDHTLVEYHPAWQTSLEN